MSPHIEELVVVCHPEEFVVSVVSRMAEGGLKYFGIALVIDDEELLVGVFNHGDLLRLVARNADLQRPISDVMVKQPVTVSEGLSDQKIIERVRTTLLTRSSGKKDVTQYVPVLDVHGRVVDVVDMYELLARSPRQGVRVEIYGLGFVGLTLAAALASRGHYVTGVDVDEVIVRSLKEGVPHVHEPRLTEMIRQGQAGNTLRFDVKPPDTHSKILIVAVGTPVDADGLVGLEALHAVCEMIGPRLRRGDIVMLRSTVPVGTTRKQVIPVLEHYSGLAAGSGFHIAFCPERTVEGQAIQELSSLPQIVGGLTEACTEKAVSFWSTLTDTVVRVDALEAAELVKLINNSYRDLSFAFANEFALLADRYNIDATRLIAAANEGYPRDKIPRPSPGVGGYCLTKDPFLYASVDGDGRHGQLSRLGREINGKAGLYPVELVRRFARKINRQLGGLRVLLVGMAFKGRPETNDLRGSASIDVAQALIEVGCEIECYDAVVSPEELQRRGLKAVDLIEGVKAADVVLILNNHEKNVPDGFLNGIGEDRRVLVFDGWNMLDRHEVERYANLVYSTLGYMTSGNHDHS